MDFQLVWDIGVHQDNSLILSTSASNIYLMIKILKKLNWKMNCIHWVIGGNLQECINNGKYQVGILDYATWTLVESSLMVDKLRQQGLHNVMQVPNFKSIKIIRISQLEFKKRSDCFSWSYYTRKRN